MRDRFDRLEARAEAGRGLAVALELAMGQVVHMQIGHAPESGAAQLCTHFFLAIVRRDNGDRRKADTDADQRPVVIP